MGGTRKLSRDWFVRVRGMLPSGWHVGIIVLLQDFSEILGRGVVGFMFPWGVLLYRTFVFLLQDIIVYIPLTSLYLYQVVILLE